MIDPIFLIIFILLVASYWFQSQKIKELAYQAVKSHCQSVQVQMLDDYVAPQGIGVRRDNTGRLCLQRTFGFEFTSTGESRYNGKIIMLGRQVDGIVMEPYRIDWE
jgi:hypothetical protein